MSSRFPEQDPPGPWRPAPPSGWPPEPAPRPAPPPGSPSGPPPGLPAWTGYSDTSTAWPESWYAPSPPRRPIATRRDLTAALAIGTLCLILGVVVGVAWNAIAPKVESVVRGPGYVPSGPESETVIGVDGRFAMLAAAAGALGALIAFVWLRRRSIGVVCALAAGGALGSLVAEFVGGWLGPAAIQTHRNDPDGTVFAHPLELTATGVLLVWPIIALIVYLGLTLLFDRDDEPPTDPGWYPS